MIYLVQYFFVRQFLSLKDIFIWSLRSFSLFLLLNILHLIIILIQFLNNYFSQFFFETVILSFQFYPFELIDIIFFLVTLYYLVLFVHFSKLFNKKLKLKIIKILFPNNYILFILKITFFSLFQIFSFQFTKRTSIVSFIF